jgi:hypothetical protein
MKSFLLFAIWITICYTGYSQEKFCSIKGVITDSVSGEILEQASVSLLRHADGSVVRRVLSGRNGFSFRRINTGNYLLCFSFIGYRTDTIRITADREDSLYNMTIKLVKSSANLMEVVVKSVIPPVIVKNDTIVYNTNTVKTEPNATIEDLIKKLPGMAVDKDGNITLHGQKVEKVYIDGKEFFLNDPKMATQNLSADMIDAIEAFDNQSERAKFTGIKDMNTNKAINLRLKKDRKKGVFGNVTANAGTMKTYSGNAQATYFKGDRWIFGSINANHISPNEQLKQSGNNRTVNFRDNIGEKIQLVANYQGRNNKNLSGQVYRRETFFGDSSLLQTREALNDNRSSGHNFNFNITFNIDSFNTLVYTPAVSWQKNEGNNFSFSSVSSQKNDSSRLSNEGETMNRVSSNGSGFNNTIAYQRRFNKRGRSLYATFYQSNNRQTQAGNLYSSLQFYDSTGVPTENRTVDQHYDQRTRANNYGMNITYTEPVKPNQVIDLGYSLNTSSGKSGKQAFNYNPLTGKYDQPDTLITNRFTNSNTQQNFSAGFNYIGKKVQYQVGVSMLYSQLENESQDHKFTTIKERFVNWSPRASAFYRLAKQKNLQVQYNGNSTSPTTDMLQPIPDLSNPYLVRLGNPSLRQQFQHQVNANYNSSNSKKFTNLSFRLGADLTQDRIVQSSILSSAGIQELKYVNVNGVYNVNSGMSYGFALNKTRNGGGDISTSMQYSRDVNFVNGVQNVRRGMGFSQQVNINYQAKDKFFAGMSAGVSYTRSKYSIGTNLNTEFLSQNYGANINYTLPLSIHVTSDFALQINGKQGTLPGTTIASWNAAMYRTFLRNNQGEIRFSVFDILNRNKGYSQTIGTNYIETRENAVLKRYFMVSFRYNFRVNKI